MITAGLFFFAFWGILFGLISGYDSLNSGLPIRGWRARVVGFVAMLPLLTACVARYWIATLFDVTGWPVGPDDFNYLMKGVELSLLIFGLVATIVLMRSWRQPKHDGRVHGAESDSADG